MTKSKRLQDCDRCGKEIKSTISYRVECTDMMTLCSKKCCKEVEDELL